MNKTWTLDECAVLEAAYRGLQKSGRGKRFDPIVFRAVAEMELAELKRELTK